MHSFNSISNQMFYFRLTRQLTLNIWKSWSSLFIHLFSGLPSQVVICLPVFILVDLSSFHYNSGQFIIFLQVSGLRSFFQKDFIFTFVIYCMYSPRLFIFFSRSKNGLFSKEFFFFLPKPRIFSRSRPRFTCV